VVSNEPLETKLLYQDVSCHRLGVVIWRFFNDTPSASGGALEGMGRRIVTFRIDQVPTKRDPGLKERLLKEAAGIFQWCWSMSEQEMATAFEARGQIESVKRSTIENLLESQPVLRFLIETYQDGCVFIQAKDLYAAFKTWTVDSGINSFSATRFGREAKKVAGVVSSETRSGTFYEIAPMSQFDEAAHFGFGDAGGEFNPPQQATHHTNPPQTKPLQCNDSQAPVVSVVGLSPTFVEERKKEENASVEEGLPFKPPHPPHPPQSANPKSSGASLFTVASRVEAAQTEGCRTIEQIASWAAQKGLSLARTEIERTLKRQGKEAFSRAA
jgi:putative DNA primase/helicase